MPSRMKLSTLPLLLALAMMTSAVEAEGPAVVVPQTIQAKAKLKMAPTETVIYVGDMHCSHCAKSVASKLYTVKGVTQVRTNVKADLAIVTPQKKKTLDPLALWAAAQASGFPAVKLVGPSGTYVVDPETKKAKKVAKSVTPAPGA